MINHITLLVSNLQKSKKFYTIALAPLEYKLFNEKKSSAGYGTEKLKCDFWIKEKIGEKHGKSFTCMAFTASNKQMVDEFWKNALKAGAKNNGAPGYRSKYYSGYYAGYVLDLDNNNIEAVFSDPLIEYKQDGLLKFRIEKCHEAFDVLDNTYRKLKGMGDAKNITMNIEINTLWHLITVIQECLVSRVSTLFDKSSSASFETFYKENQKYQEARNEPIIKKIRKWRHTIASHASYKSMTNGSYIQTEEILQSNIKDVLEKLKTILPI